MSRGDGDYPDRAPRRVLVPRVPVLVAGFREVLWLDPDGEIEALAPAEARSRVERETAMLCHAPAAARRLDTPGFPALDLLELFAFVYPARFCVPTPRGLPEPLGLHPPPGTPESCVTLATAARATNPTTPRRASRKRGRGSERPWVTSLRRACGPRRTGGRCGSRPLRATCRLRSRANSTGSIPIPRSSAATSSSAKGGRISFVC